MIKQNRSPDQPVRPAEEHLAGVFDSPCKTLTVDQAAVALGISRGSAYQAAKNGTLPVVRVGKRLLVPKTALARLLAV